MNILADFVGHVDLWYSLHSLFEKRLGGTLYHPDGPPGWDIKLNSPTCGHTEDEFLGRKIEDGICYSRMQMEPGAGFYTQKGISFEAFKDTKFDILITTNWANEEPFCQLVDKYQPQAKLIRQIGNIGEIPRFCKNVLWGMLTPPPSDIRFIRYHPEHYEEYKYTDPPANNIIKSFMDDLPFTAEIETWNKLKTLLPEFKFMCHGRGGEDLNLLHTHVPKAMRLWTSYYNKNEVCFNS
ncbi:MAG: hypothetical protein ACW98X_27580 [Promethearchaeota archaeon]